MIAMGSASRAPHLPSLAPPASPSASLSFSSLSLRCSAATSLCCRQPSHHCTPLTTAATLAADCFDLDGTLVHLPPSARCTVLLTTTPSASMSPPTDPSHPLIQRLLDEAVASRGGWTAGAPTNSFDAIAAFIAAVHWSQPFFYALLTLHLALLLLSFLLRHRAQAQLALLAGLLGLVSFSERLNGWCARHWRQLTSDDYFDEGGIFAALAFSAPIAIIGLITLVSGGEDGQSHASPLIYHTPLPCAHPSPTPLSLPLCCAVAAQLQLLYDTASLLIFVKRKQLQLQRRRKASASAAANGDAPPPTTTNGASTAQRRRPVDEAHHAKFVLD